MVSTDDAPGRSPTPWLAALAAGCAVFASIVVGIAAIMSARAGGADAPPIVRAGRLLVPNNINAAAQGDEMLVANRPGAPLTILAVRTLPFRAGDYARVLVEAAPVPREVSVALIWVRRDDPGRPYEQQLDADHGVLAATALDRTPEWRDEITFLGIGVKGPMERPWALRAFRLEPASTASTLADIARGWVVFEPWDGRSINVVFGGREEQRLWLPPVVFAASLAAALALLAVARRRGAKVAPLSLAVPFVIGWMVLDLRWHRNLAEQARATWGQFGGRSYSERHLAMDDGDLFRFVEAARARLPREPVRVFATADFEYFRRRAGYHLYPHNVLAYDWADPDILRPGDYVLFYQKNDVRYDSGARELIWNSGQRVSVSAVLAQRGAGVFEVRARQAP